MEGAGGAGREAGGRVQRKGEEGAIDREGDAAEEGDLTIRDLRAGGEREGGGGVREEAGGLRGREG